MKRQLRGSDGCLAADQCAHDRSADNQRAGLSAAADKVLGVLYLSSGEQANADDQHQHQDDPCNRPYSHKKVAPLLWGGRTGQSEEPRPAHAVIPQANKMVNSKVRGNVSVISFPSTAGCG